MARSGGLPNGGPQDERGAANRLTPQKVLEATKLIHDGKIYSLGRVYEHGMPLFGKRHFSLTIPGSPTHPPSGKNQSVFFDELFSGEIGQVGTQFDGLGHAGVRIGDEDFFYNGFKRTEFATPFGLNKLGIHNVGTDLYSRRAARRGRSEKGETAPQRFMRSRRKIWQACLSNARNRPIPPRRRRVCAYRPRRTVDEGQRDIRSSGAPGIGMAAARWLSASRRSCSWGVDNPGIEVMPSEDPQQSAPVHQWNLVRNGIYQLENLDLAELAADKVFEFAFVFSPLPLKGATGSPGNPIAVR